MEEHIGKETNFTERVLSDENVTEGVHGIESYGLERILQVRNNVAEKQPTGKNLTKESLNVTPADANVAKEGQNENEGNVIEDVLMKHVSERFFGKSVLKLSDKGRTVIKTDTDLLIEGMYLRLPDEWYSFDNVASDVINITITNTTIEDIEMRFTGRNVSLRIENSFIFSSRMDFWQHSSPITIHNCTFDKGANKYSLLSFSNSAAQFLNCTFTGIKTIDCYDSHVTMTTTIIKGNVGNFLKTKQCNVAITSSDFMDNMDIHLTSIGSNGLISNCVFSNNSGAILNVEQGKLIIKNSQFLNNTNQDGEIITIKEGCKADVINSTFTGNEAVDGAALGIYHRSHVTTAGCWFLGNIAKGRGGAIYVSYRSRYMDYGSLFADNKAGVAGNLAHIKF